MHERLASGQHHWSAWLVHQRQCTLDGLFDNPLTGGDRFDVCVTNYTTKD